MAAGQSATQVGKVSQDSCGMCAVPLVYHAVAAGGHQVAAFQLLTNMPIKTGNNQLTTMAVSLVAGMGDCCM